MINGLSRWAEQIIVAVIIATLIEMILPSGNNKKYIKAVIGVYILFTIISPIFGNDANFHFNEIDYKSYFTNTQEYQTMSDTLISNNDMSTQEIYLANLKQDMKQKLKEKGYLAEKIAIRYEVEEGENYGKIYEIYLDVSKIEEEEKESKQIENLININTINKVNIGNEITNTTGQNITTKEKLSSNEQKKVKEYLSGVYEVSTKNIRINENT